MSYETILYDVQDNVATITLNRPDRMNAWNGTMAAELSAALTAANEDDEVRAVVITGAGGAFCAGADLERGVGMTYPMLCDIRIAAEDAKMGFVFTRRGMIPELASHLVVQRVAGLSTAADLLMSGRIFMGKEAAELGIASKALPAGEVLDHATEIAKEYVNAAPVSVAITKRLLWEGLDSNPGEMRKREGPLFAWAGNQPDAKEGIRSFVEKRRPEWTMSAARDLPDML